MKTIQELIDDFDATGGPIFEQVEPFDPTEAMVHLGQRIVLAQGQPYSIVEQGDDPSDCSKRTDYFDWHTDGLYHPVPPRFVLMTCLDPGNGSPTELASVDEVLRCLSGERLAIFKKLQSHYIGRNSVYAHPIVQNNSEALLASRGFVGPRLEIALEDMPSIRDIVETLEDFYDCLEHCAFPYHWDHSGLTLIFDQYKYLHRRQSPEIDYDRKHLRMWFNEPSPPSKFHTITGYAA